MNFKAARTQEVGRGNSQTNVKVSEVRMYVACRLQPMVNTGKLKQLVSNGIQGYVSSFYYPQRPVSDRL